MEHECKVAEGFEARESSRSHRLENISENWFSYHQLLLSLFEQEKTIHQMDSTQLAYITDLAHKCPMDNTVANAQAILYLLYGIEIEDCEEYTTRSKHNVSTRPTTPRRTS